jgi:hypothetical protein
MTITEQDIRRLRREAERDLEALARVESMLARRNGASPVEHADPDKKVRGQLKQFVIVALKAAGINGLRPNEVLKSVKDKGYQFNSEDGAAASISTVLGRLLTKDKRVEKKDGKYLWKVETGKD